MLTIDVSGLPGVAPRARSRRPIHRSGRAEEEGGVHGRHVHREFGEGRKLRVRVVEIDQVGVDRENGRRLRGVRVQAVLQTRELRDLVRGEPVPVVEGKRLDARRHPVGRIGARVRDRVRVVVVPVQEDDSLEPRRRERGAEIGDQRHERRNPDVHEPGEADVGIGQGVADRRRDHGANLRRHPARHLLRDQHVSGQRPVRAVLLGRSGGNDHRVMRFEERFDLAIGHLSEKNGGRFHRRYLSYPALTSSSYACHTSSGIS